MTSVVLPRHSKTPKTLKNAEMSALGADTNEKWLYTAVPAKALTCLNRERLNEHLRVPRRWNRCLRRSPVPNMSALGESRAPPGLQPVGSPKALTFRSLSTLGARHEHLRVIGGRS
jgi:hypothetical protein